MLGRLASARVVRALHTHTRALHTSTLRAAAEGAPAPAGSVLPELTLTFAVPSAPIVNKKAVRLVTVPGRGGVFGVEKSMPATLSELQPGLVRIDYADAATPAEELFVPGGFVFKHANNVLDVSSTEAVKLDQIDTDALRAAYAEASKRKEGAAATSKEAAEANIALEVYRAVAQTLKVTL